MRRILVVTILAAAMLTYTAGPVAAFGVASPSSDVEAEKHIRSLYDDFVAAWNRHDPVAMADQWAIDGDHIEPDGTVAKGRTDVTVLLTRQHDGVFKDTTLELEIESVWFISREVALIDGAYSVSGIHAPDGTEIPKRMGHLTSILLKEKDRWWIAASRLMIPTSLPYKKE